MVLKNINSQYQVSSRVKLVYIPFTVALIYSAKSKLCQNRSLSLYTECPKSYARFLFVFKIKIGRNFLDTLYIDIV